MSNFLAIAAVTATLQAVLQGTVGTDVPGATVTTVRPDSNSSGLPPRGVNLYLYQVTPNSAWRNADLPTRTGDSRLVQRPRVALDLHYLFTFYGSELTLEPQRVLGGVARTLHAQPMLTREEIRTTRQHALADDPDHFLRESDLADEVELVKFMPLSLSLEELSKLWSVFFQTPYTLSMAYLATTVLIEATTTPQRALPVRVRNLTARPFHPAVIERVIGAASAQAPITVMDTLLIQGRGLAGAVRAVLVGEAAVLPTTATDTEIRLTLSGAELRAGVQAIQIAYTDGATSNVVPLVLRPRITINPAEVSATMIPVTFTPAVGRAQQVLLSLNEHQAPSQRAPRAYSFPSPAQHGLTDEAATSTTTIRFPVANVEPGTYLVRVQVAGAESLLTSDVNGAYVAPLVTMV
ncbi:MAG: DUF4255 domain-containing protein [Caldilineaceae bacterium]|nr:DUF4255 domain-containing protein [Caldilineaceae bacterium]